MDLFLFRNCPCTVTMLDHIGMRFLVVSGLLNLINVRLHSLEDYLLLALALDEEQRMVVVVNRLEKFEILALLHH